MWSNLSFSQKRNKGTNFEVRYVRDRYWGERNGKVKEFLRKQLEKHQSLNSAPTCCIPINVGKKYRVTNWLLLCFTSLSLSISKESYSEDCYKFPMFQSSKKSWVFFQIPPSLPRGARAASDSAACWPAHRVRRRRRGGRRVPRLTRQRAAPAWRGHRPAWDREQHERSLGAEGTGTGPARRRTPMCADRCRWGIRALLGSDRWAGAAERGAGLAGEQRASAGVGAAK